MPTNVVERPTTVEEDVVIHDPYRFIRGAVLVGTMCLESTATNHVELSSWAWETIDSPESMPRSPYMGTQLTRMLGGYRAGDPEVIAAMYAGTKVALAYIKEHYPQAVPVIRRAIQRKRINGKTFAGGATGRCVLGWVAYSLTNAEREGRDVSRFAELVLRDEIPDSYALECFVYNVHPGDGQTHPQLAFIEDALR